MLTAIYILFGLTALIGFLQDKVDARLAETNNDALALAWFVLKRVAFGGTAWVLLSVITSAALLKVFPDQSPYFLSGSPATVGPLLVWAIIIGWVLTGKREASETERPTATTDGRIDAILNPIFDAIAWVIVNLKWMIAFAVGAVAFGVVAFFGFSALGSLTEHMSPSAAIIIGAIIIAVTIAQTNQNK